MKVRVNRHTWLAIVGVVAVFASLPAWGQTDPSGILNQYQSAQVSWQNAIAPYAYSLFKLLATVDFAWTCITVALEKQDAQGVVAAIIKKLMTIGIFWTILVYGPAWFPLIIQSFVQIGGAASGEPTPLTPSGILQHGRDIAAILFNGAINNSSILSPVASTIAGLALMIAALAVLVSYLVITVHFIMAMVESYLVIGAGYIFLGFGGSRWTSNYAEKYISQVISVGARLMVLYLVIGVGEQFANQWITEASAAVAVGAANINPIWEIMMEVAIYGIICWILPKIAGNVIGGTLSVSGGDAFGMAAAGATAGIAAASAALALTGVGAPAAAGASAVAGAANAAGAAAGTAGTIGGAAGTIAGAGASGGSAVAGAGGAAGFGSAAFAAPGAGTSAGSAASVAGAAPSAAGSTGAATQPPPPASAMASANGSSSGAGGGTGPASSNGGGSSAGSRSVAQPPPPAAELAAARKGSGGLDVEKLASKVKQGIDATIGRAPEGPTISGAGLSIGHAAE